MGGVYRIQTFFGFLYIFYIYKAPNSSLVVTAFSTPTQWCITSPPKRAITLVYHQMEDDEGGRGRWSEGCSEGGN